MRVCLLVLAASSICGSSLSESEACWFLGARLNKEIGATCVAGQCATEDSRLGLTCVEAVALASSIISNSDGHGDSEPAAKRHKSSEATLVYLVNVLREELIAELEESLYMGEWAGDWDLRVQRFKTANSLMLKLASNWQHWKTTRVSLNEETQRYFRAAEGFVQQRILSGKSEDEIILQSHEIVAFAFDLVSLLDIKPSTESRQSFKIFQYCARARHGEYREKYPREISNELPYEPDATVDWVLSVSSEMRRAISTPPIPTTHLPAFTEFVLRLLDSTHMDPIYEESTEELLRQQLEFEVCPCVHVVLGANFMGRRPADGRESLQVAALIVRLHNFCGWPSGKKDAGRKLSSLAFFLVFGYKETIVRSINETDSVIKYFTQPEAVWFGRFEGSPKLVLRKIIEYIEEQNPFTLTNSGLSLLENRMRILRSRSELGDRFETVMIGLGRALALAYREGCDLAKLKIEAHIVRILTTEILPKYGDTNNLQAELGIVHETLMENLIEPLYFVRKGAMHVMGALGFESLSQKEVEARFGLLL